MPGHAERRVQKSVWTSAVQLAPFVSGFVAGPSPSRAFEFRELAVSTGSIAIDHPWAGGTPEATFVWAEEKSGVAVNTGMARVKVVRRSGPSCPIVKESRGKKFKSDKIKTVER